jgi:hypothetical protein
MPDLTTGDHVPNFALPDHQGDMWVLAQRLQDGPVILVFYRGIGDHIATGSWSALPGTVGNPSATEHS